MLDDDNASSGGAGGGVAAAAAAAVAVSSASLLVTETMVLAGEAMGTLGGIAWHHGNNNSICSMR